MTIPQTVIICLWALFTLLNWLGLDYKWLKDRIKRSKTRKS